MMAQLDNSCVPPYECEFRFATSIGRDWRFDFAWLPEMIAVEVEGGIYTRGRHVRIKGFYEDCDKYNAATAMGWRVFRFTKMHLDSNLAIPFLEDVFYGYEDTQQGEPGQ